jgi:outer membrane receptor protein involved in Fe transport
LDVRFSIWQWSLTDIIEKRSVQVDLNTLRFQFQNLTELASRGAEVETSYRDASGWLAFASATYTDVERNRGLDPYPQPNSPALTANLGVSTPPLRDLAHLSAECNYLHSRHTREPDTDTDAWLGLNLVAYVPYYRGFDVTVGVRNLLGTREQIPAQSDYDRYYWESGSARRIEVPLVPGYGRELFARVGYRY